MKSKQQILRTARHLPKRARACDLSRSRTRCAGTAVTAPRRPPQQNEGRRAPRPPPGSAVAGGGRAREGVCPSLGTASLRLRAASQRAASLGREFRGFGGWLCPTDSLPENSLSSTPRHTPRPSTRATPGGPARASPPRRSALARPGGGRASSGGPGPSHGHRLPSHVPRPAPVQLAPSGP